MTRERAWEMLIRQHPEYLERPPRFTANGLRQFFDWVWSIAESEGRNREADTLLRGTIDSKGSADLSFLRTIMGMDK